MYLGAPDRCVRYEIGRLSSRVPNQVMRDPSMPPSCHASRTPVFMGVIGFPSKNNRDHVGGPRRNERWSGWRRYMYLLSYTFESVSFDTQTVLETNVKCARKKTVKRHGNKLTRLEEMGYIRTFYLSDT